MDKQKQIEEMAYEIETRLGHLKSTCYITAETLYAAGYRKQSEGEWIYHECVSSYDGAKSGYSCSRCNAFVDEDVFDADEFHKVYCGNCGAKMKGE